MSSQSKCVFVCVISASCDPRYLWNQEAIAVDGRQKLPPKKKGYFERQVERQSPAGRWRWSYLHWLLMWTGVHPVSDTTCWPSTRLMQRTKLSTAMAQWAVTACKAHQYCLVNLSKCMVECYIVSVLLRNVTFRSVPISCRLLGLSLPCYALGMFLERAVPLGLFRRISWTVSVIVLDRCNNTKHKASIFVHSHVDKSIRNLKNIPEGTFSTDLLWSHDLTLLYTLWVCFLHSVIGFVFGPL